MTTVWPLAPSGEAGPWNEQNAEIAGLRLAGLLTGCVNSILDWQVCKTLIQQLLFREE